MITRRHGDSYRPTRRKLVFVSLLRSTASVAVMVTVYYYAPLDRQLDTGALARFLLGLAALAGILAWQVRSILDSEIPRLRAIEIATVGVPLVLLLYASAYVIIAENQPGGFTEDLGRTDALYFAVTVFATVGFGDIAPKSELARILTTTQMIVNLIAVGVLAKIVLGAVQLAVRRRTDLNPDPPSSSSSSSSSLPSR